MHDARRDDAVAGSHEIPGDKPEREDHYDNEKKDAWRVSHPGMRARKDSRLKNVGNARAKEPFVVLQEESTKEEFLFEAVRDRYHEQHGSQCQKAIKCDNAVRRQQTLSKAARSQGNCG